MIHSLPPAALRQHIAILGKTGSGKTYAAKGAVEALLEAKERVCIIDPTSAWWGLKSSSTGKSGGYPLVIFGGAHADFPLGGAHGEALAEIIGTSSTPAIIDTSQLKVGERTRFFADFADALVRKNRGPLQLVIDEAHLFAPQGKVNDPQSGAMLHAANNLVSLGRSRGLRIVLITQRPAKLHKDSLTQVETLVALRLIAPQDRKAVESWIEDNADEKKGREIIESLAALKTGHGWVWAPELGILERVAFPKISTFDSSRAPDEAADGKGPVLAPIDRDSISSRLQIVAAEAVANDPARLKARVRELEQQVKRGEKSAPMPSPELLQAAEARGFERGHQEAQRAAAAHLKSLKPLLHQAIESALSGAPAPLQSRATPAPAVRSAPQPRRDIPQRTNGSTERLPVGEVAVLSACIQFPDGLRREQITVLTGYKRSTRDAYIQRLREKGYVEGVGELITATDEGCAALPDAEPLPTGEALQDYWFNRLPEGERAILRVLVDRYPDAVPRDTLTDETEYKRSTRDAYLQRLAAKQLVAEPSRGEVRASEALFQ